MIEEADILLKTQVDSVSKARGAGDAGELVGVSHRICQTGFGYNGQGTIRREAEATYGESL